jgi:hypothetical protein
MTTRKYTDCFHAGSVPKQLGRLAAVKTGGALSLGVNELNGPFPEWLLTSNATADGSLSLTLQVQCWYQHRVKHVQNVKDLLFLGAVH